MSTYQWDWGLPGISIPPPPGPEHSAPTSLPPSWEDLKFNPIGLYNLRRRLGVFPNQPGVYTTHKPRFDAADLAWIAAGASEDGRHHVAALQFFSAFFVLRNSLPTDEAGWAQRKGFSGMIQKLIFDLATMWDRTFGGTTMVLHIDGTTRPKALKNPEYLKAHVYIPPVFVEENPGSHLAIAHIVQMFIEYIGLPTVDRWTQAANAIGWKLNWPSPTPEPYLPGPLIPFPQPETAYYKFLGRPWGNLPVLSAPIPAPTQLAADSSGPPPSFDDIFDDDPIDDHTLSVLDLHDRCYSLTVSLSKAEDLAEKRLVRQQELMEQIDELQEEIKDILERNTVLHERLLARTATSTSKVSPSTPSRTSTIVVGGQAFRTDTSWLFQTPPVTATAASGSARVPTTPTRAPPTPG
ncbi:hypothetical protein C8J57DRAFT_1249687 [Mycena rebaudengoi]|nr:hypothetical protein C8J57DRAFT_1249687 [Mycena rebaudengoi]